MKKSLNAIFLAVILFAIILLPSCSSKQLTTNYSEGDERVVGETNQQIALDNTNEKTSTLLEITENALVGRKIIKTATVDIETLNYDTCINSFETLVNTAGGFIQNSNVQGTSQNIDKQSTRKATYTVRIPADKLNEFLKNVGSIGVVKNSSVSGEDVTSQYFDTETRIKSLKIEEECLLEIKTKAKTLSELLELENRMTQVRTQIEQLTGQLKKLDALVELATVNIIIDEVKKIEDKVPDNFLSKIGFVFKSSIEVLFEGVKILILGIIAIAPFAVVIGIVIFIMLFILKKIRKNTK